MVDGKIEGRGRFWRSGHVSKDPRIGIRTQELPPQRPAECSPYAYWTSTRDWTGPPKRASTSHTATIPFGPTEVGKEEQQAVAKRPAAATSAELTDSVGRIN